MSLYQSTYHSRLYRDFLAIEPKDFRGIIRFYEEKEEQVDALDFDERFELLCAYTNALFEVGAYRQHLAIVDRTIADSFQQTERPQRETSGFCYLLFRKAAAHYQTHQFSDAEYILRELIRIDPENEDAIRFLRKTLYHRWRPLLRRSQAAAIFIFMLTALIIGVEVLLIRPFYGQLTMAAEATRTGFFVLGILLLAAGEGYAYWQAYRQTEVFLQEQRRRRRGRVPK